MTTEVLDSKINLDKSTEKDGIKPDNNNSSENGVKDEINKTQKLGTQDDKSLEVKPKKKLTPAEALKLQNDWEIY